MSKIDEFKQKINELFEELKKKLPSHKAKDNYKFDLDDEYEEGEFEQGDEEEFDEATSHVKVDPGKVDEEVDIDDIDDIDDFDPVKDEDEVDLDFDLDSESEEDDEVEEEDEDEDLKKQKQKKLIINGALVLLIAYLLIDVMTTKDEQPQEDEATPQRKARPKAVKKANTSPNNEQVVESISTPLPEPTPVPTVMATPIPTPTPIPEPTPTEIPEPTPDNATTSNENDASNSIDTQEVDENSLEGNNEVPVGEIEGDKKLDNQDDASDLVNALKENIKQEQEQVMEQEALEEEREKDISYIAPPNYKRLGRGLVYNCLDKHWACVDKFAYFQCRENFNYNKTKSKRAECYVKNVYASEEDCSVIQTYYINMGEPTDFCNNSESEDVKTKIELQGN
jgi:cytoskeletal protein RodZ